MPTFIAYNVGMQYTLRKVPVAVDRALRRKARKEGRSLNEVAVEALTRGAGVDQPLIENRELDFLIGTWVEDPEVEKSLADQRQIDQDLWK